MAKKRILFVDDEENILQGIKRLLRGLRKEWDMDFAFSGKEALEIMAEEAHYDVIVSDMRMPGMDGAELLTTVMKLYPNTLRIVLSGQADQDTVMRTVRTSHRYLSKPCDPDALKATIAQSLALRELLGGESLQEVVTGITTMPSLPAVYNKVVEKLRSEESSLNEVGEIIAHDPGMTAKILQLVNSAYFGLGRHIANPAEAASYLGLDTLKNLVLSVGVFSQFDASMAKSLSLEQVVSHSNSVGYVAKSIAEQEKASANIVSDAYLAGLLHELGKLILAVGRPDELLRVKEMIETQNIDPFEAEKSVFGTTHAEVGAYLLGLWGITETVVAAVGYQHHPGACPDATFSALTAVHVADAITHVRESRVEGQAALEEHLDLEYLERLELTNRIPVWCQLSIPTIEDAA